MEGNCRWYAHVNVLRTLVDGLSQELDFDPFAEPPEAKKGSKKRAQKRKGRRAGKRTQMIRANPSGTPMPTIDRLESGTIVIEGTTHHSDMMILRDGRVKTLRLEEGSVLRAKDVNKVIKAKPEVTILSYGTAGNLRLGPEVESRLRQARIQLQSYRTHKAIETCRELRNQRKTAAVLHITA